MIFSDKMKNDLLVVNEIFFSIQGESTHAGRPCAFVRLTHCNLRCSYCDTGYAFYGGEEIPLSEIIHKIESYPTNLVEITGGEPLLQKGVHLLIKQLLDGGKTVLIETGGTLDIRSVDPRAVLIYDIKCPGSGMVKENLWANISHLKSQDEIKFVMGSRRDYKWAKTKIRELGLTQKHIVLLSPVWGTLEPRKLAEWILEDGLPVRLQVQFHKILWGSETRGV